MIFVNDMNVVYEQKNFDPKKQNIAALHAGWKGAYKNIIKNTLKK